MDETNKSQILVVDDTPQNLRLLTEILLKHGYKVRPAISGNLALRSIERESPDLILMDIRMPGMDGFEVCEKIKQNEQWSQIPVIFISALDDIEDKVKGFEVGGVDYIIKPFQESEVLKRVQTHLKLWHLSQEMIEKNTQLKLEVEERTRAEEALQRAYNEVESQVIERTRELRITNDQLLEKESQVRGILDAIPDLLFVLDKNGVFLECVTKPEKRLYVSEEMFLNKTVSEVLPEWFAQLTLEKINLALEAKRTQMYEYELPINGEKCYFEAHMASIDREKVVCIIHDITERKQVEETIRRINDELELKVEQRTAELKQTNMNLVSTNEELENAYAELSSAQQQILQQEKMASIGQLAAGVAHEINNPLGFIISNTTMLKSYVEKYSELLDHLRTWDYKNNGWEEVLTAIDGSEFQFIKEDLEDLFKDTMEGLDRVSKIVKSLRRFARIDSSSECEPFNLNEEMENVLSITYNELKYIADVKCDLEPVEEIHGNAGQINQVLLNILLNAGAAIKRKQSLERGTIEIRTWQETDKVKLAICDNGEGIEEKNLNKIFDPFFTTKPVGEGTGLGLSISYDIVVNKHLGAIEVTSELGERTEFVITLPIKSVNGSTG